MYLEAFDKPELMHECADMCAKEVGGMCKVRALLRPAPPRAPRPASRLHQHAPASNHRLRTPAAPATPQGWTYCWNFNNCALYARVPDPVDANKLFSAKCASGVLGEPARGGRGRRLPRCGRARVAGGAAGSAQPQAGPGPCRTAPGSSGPSLPFHCSSPAPAASAVNPRLRRGRRRPVRQVVQNVHQQRADVLHLRAA
jgi:hypothetical protein